MSQNEGRIARNVVGTLITQIVTWGMAAVVTLFLPRYIKDEGMGQLGIVTSLAMIVGVFVPLGTSQVIVKEVARDRSKAGQLLVGAFILRLLLGILAVPMVYLLASIMHYTDTIRMLVLVAIPGMLVFVLNDVFVSVCQGLEEAARVNRASLLDKTIYSVTAVSLVFLKAPLWAIIGISAITGLVPFFYYTFALASLWKNIPLPRFAELRALAMTSLPFMGVKVFQTLYGQTDAIVLGALTTDRETGWYTVAFRLLGTAMFFPMALAFALLPTLARSHSQGDHAGFISLARRSFDITLLAGLPIAAVAICLPKQIIAILFGPTFAAAAPVLVVGGFGMLLYFVTAVLGTMVIAMDRQGIQARSGLVACAFGIPLCVVSTWAGHRYWENGALGAILSDLVVEIYLAVVYFKALPRDLFDASMLSRLFRYILAAVPMVIGLYLSLGTPLGLWGAIPCALVYLLGCVALRCWSLADLKALRGMLIRRTT